MATPTTVVDPTVTYQFDAVSALNRDLKKAARMMRRDEVSYLVDQFYKAQDDRKRFDNQLRALEKAGGKPNQVLLWLSDNVDRVETSTKAALAAWAENDPVSSWTLSLPGFGPIIAAGLSAYIPMEKTPSVSALWSFAGQNPTARWEKGQKRPWNARLKTLCWKIGESLVKVSNNPNDIYGKLYKERRAYEVQRNLMGEYADAAEAKLQRFKISKDTEAYPFYAGMYDVPILTEEGRIGVEDLMQLGLQTGGDSLLKYKAALKANEVAPGEGIRMLPPAHIHARAKRYALKIFLSHWWNVAYVHHYQKEPPDPWILTPQGGHRDRIPIPNKPAWAEPYLRNR